MGQLAYFILRNDEFIKTLSPSWYRTLLFRQGRRRGKRFERSVQKLSQRLISLRLRLNDLNNLNHSVPTVA
jgi:hypothetical protein